MYGYFYKAGKTWEDVKLWEATKDNEVISFAVADFIKQDTYWNIGTFKDLAEEIKMALKADYSYPIIIDEQGGLVDGAHRIVHAYLDGVETIKAVIIREEQFPEPDYDEHKTVSDNAPQFKCQRCGACCRLVGLSVIPEIKALAKENTDACRYLTSDNLCSIYEKRPIFCQVDGMYDQYVKQQGITREEWYEKNHKSCTYLRGLLRIKELKV